MAGWNRWKDLLAPPMTRLEPGQATMIIIVMDKDQDQIPKMCRAEKAGLRSVRRALDGEQGPPPPPTHPAGWAPSRIAAPRLRAVNPGDHVTEAAGFEPSRQRGNHAITRPLCIGFESRTPVAPVIVGPDFPPAVLTCLGTLDPGVRRRNIRFNLYAQLISYNSPKRPHTLQQYSTV
ncbi:hypothetical protein BJV77DRAFT_651394 [Russula vinacea]|nr:hypothetical protein BJV77DRAFT_651394 [Russula vinacea]